MSARLTGLVAATYTPMHADGSVSLAPIEKQAQALAANRVSGAFVCGTTGEGVSLTTEERMRVAERWREVAGADLKVVVHVAHTSLSEARALAGHAQEIGADAIAALSPYFFRPARIEELLAFCAGIAGAAPKLPFYYYHIPLFTGVSFSMAEFLERGSRRIPSLAGVKFTDENLMDFGRCLAVQGGRFDLLFGRDEILLSALALGARGAIGSTYNFAAPLYHRILAAFRSGDRLTAQREQLRAMEMAAILSRYGGLAAGKALMKRVGIDCGPVRLPLRPLSEPECDALYAELETIGLAPSLSAAPA